jgi:hypothetical protein
VLFRVLGLFDRTVRFRDHSFFSSRCLFVLLARFTHGGSTNLFAVRGTTSGNGRTEARIRTNDIDHGGQFQIVSSKCEDQAFAFLIDIGFADRSRSGSKPD